MFDDGTKERVWTYEMTPCSGESVTPPSENPDKDKVDPPQKPESEKPKPDAGSGKKPNETLTNTGSSLALPLSIGAGLLLIGSALVILRRRASLTS